MGRVNAPRVRFPARLLCTVVVLASVWVPSGTALADVSTGYVISGIEVWATPTVGTFAGAALGTSGDAATWAARIEHTVQTQPSGTITGGWATLVTSERNQIHGRFSRGTLLLIDDGGPNCGNLRHSVTAKLVDVARSDSGGTGTGRLKAILTHYRVNIFGNCIAWSASVSGLITLSF